MSFNLTRHTLVYLDDKSTLETSIGPQHDSDFFYFWVKNRRPFIFTRQPHSIPQDFVQLGVPYYQQSIKHRYQFIVHYSSIRYVSSLPKLHHVLKRFESDELSIETYVYGSYAWQYLTNEIYVHPQSDLDLLIDYNHCKMVTLKTHLSDIKNKMKGISIDAEIRFQTFGDCSIYELFNEQVPTILFKQVNAVHLINREELYECFPALLS